MDKFISSQFNFKNQIFSIGQLFFLIFLLTTCSKEVGIGEDVVLTTVGNEKITVEEFRKNYEFGLPHLKSEPNRKLSYLNYMIYEKILSIEGYNLGYQNSERVKKLEKVLLDELLIEELFTENVNSKIKIKPEEVREAVLKSKVKWKMSYWFESDKEQAYFIYNEMKNNGFEKTIDKIIKSNPEVNLKTSDFTTDFIDWTEIDPIILEKISNLKIDEISEPIKVDNGYFLFRIKDLQREPISEYSIKENYERYRQILYYRKLKEKATKYVASVMGPKNVKTKGKPLFELTNIFLDWKREKSKVVFRDYVTEKSPELLSKVLVTFDKENWKVEDFLKKFDPTEVKDETLNVKKTGGEISQLIALQVRNYVLTNLAKDDNLEESENLQKQLIEWRNKWVYSETRRHYLKDLKITDAEAKTFFEKNIKSFQVNAEIVPKYEEFKNSAKKFAYIQKADSILVKKIDSLKEKYSIKINRAVLDTITTIDFNKSRWQSLQVFKKSTNRMASPIVDPAWKIK